ncbi:helix-turn-helix transcriptional regulator [Ferrimonas pelagia]|uniref:HTH cro/C1-type domain-containing protein n=1 Tax=Ferrimonas pelagia TaxID=1177826 RepID=A0ABP9EIG0_9GAMM
MVTGRRLIKEARKRRGMTQLDLAEFAGMSERQVRRLESGEAAVSFNQLRYIVEEVCRLNFIELQRELANEIVETSPV